MNRLDTFTKMFSDQASYISLLDFAVNLVLTFVLASLVAAMYRRYGASLSNRDRFSKNLVLISMTTMLIITIVKSSLALSLGLVGALSIVRFRTAIKEPEELSYLFLSIALGLGLGAQQRLVTFLGFLLIALVIRFRKSGATGQGQQAMLMSVSSQTSEADFLDRVVQVLEKHAKVLDLKRMDQTPDEISGDFSLVFEDFKKLDSARKELRGLEGDLRVSFLDTDVA